MLKTLRCGRKSFHAFQKAVTPKRTFLSEAYRCTEAWQSRLNSPVLQNIDPENLFIQINNKHTLKGEISAIDVDIFANILRDKSYIEELLSSVYKLRLTAETSNTLESTHHAVIRYLWDHDCTDELMNVLYDRLNYGIFPDYVCYNALMDSYIKRKDYGSAAKIAVLPMLQEDFDNPITNALCIYSCHKYLENPEVWVKPQEPVDDGEEIKIRVKYLINDYFDDHFDLTDPRDLVGKTLAFYGKIMNNTLGRTCQLRGLILYKKYEEVSNLIEQWSKDVQDDLVYKEVFDLIKKDNQSIPEEEIGNIMSELDKLKSKNLCENSLIEAIESEVRSAIDKQADIDITNQLKMYTEWEEKRKKVLEEQTRQMEIASRLDNVQKIKEEMMKQERLLTFFDEEENIELKISEIEAEEEAEMERILKMPKSEKKLRKLKATEEYVPPTISN
ncbi:uncharacterized protein LOC116429516 [Nomia melanderi]|uniref:uncharacterized protein LOC116429516 n=1 Tax=Nomia melanderi TaxID=2448451 RepID=UPI003FCDF0A9